MSIVNICTKSISTDLYYDTIQSVGDNMDYRQIMRNLREDHDYTQEYVAHVLGTSQTMYARYERGANELPIHHLIRLCKLYQVSADYLLGLTKEKHTK